MAGRRRTVRFRPAALAVLSALLFGACAAPSLRVRDRPPAGDRIYRLTAAIGEAPAGEIAGILTVRTRRPGEIERPERIERRVPSTRSGGTVEIAFDFVAPASPERFDLSLDVRLPDGRHAARPLDPTVVFARTPPEKVWIHLEDLPRP